MLKSDDAPAGEAFPMEVRRRVDLTDRTRQHRKHRDKDSFMKPEYTHGATHFQNCL